jgi:hypothetical protein
MHNLNPSLIFALGVGAVWYAHATRAEIGILRWPIYGAALVCCGLVMLILRGLPVCCAMVGVTAEEIKSFQRQFEEALRIADISISKASVWLYGREDHGRLRHELAGEGGGVSAVRMRRLPARFHRAWLEKEADAHQIDIVTTETLARALRVAALAPKPEPVSMREAPCATRAS